MSKLAKYIRISCYMLLALYITYQSLSAIFDLNKLLEPSDWINIITPILTTLLTIGVTIYIFESEEKREEIKTEQENKPVLVLGISTYKDIDISNVVDLEDSEVPLKELRNDSNVEIPLINGGRTPVFNINYFFEIENIEEVKSYYKSSSFETISPKLTFKEKIEYGGEEIDQLTYHYETDTSSYMKHVKIARFSREIPAIMPEKEELVNLPTYFIVLLYDYFIMPFNDDMPVPICKMFITYDDFNMERHKEEYLINLARYSTSKNILNYTLIGSKSISLEN